MDAIGLELLTIMGVKIKTHSLHYRNWTLEDAHNDPNLSLSYASPSPSPSPTPFPPRVSQAFFSLYLCLFLVLVSPCTQGRVLPALPSPLPSTSAFVLFGLASPYPNILPYFLTLASPCNQAITSPALVSPCTSALILPAFASP